MPRRSETTLKTIAPKTLRGPGRLRPALTPVPETPAVAAEAQDRQFVTALGRGLEILGCFSAARPSLGITEIATMLRIPQPTVWRLCHTMIKLGYLAADREDRLRPTLAVLRLGFSVLSDLRVEELARPHLQELADGFGGAAGIAVREGNDMRLVVRCEGESELVLNLQAGSRIPLTTSALGWAFLAGLPAAERQAAVEANEAVRKTWALVGAAFERAYAEYLEQGFIVNPGVFHPGYNTAAVPVFGPDGRALFAMNCGGVNAILPLARLRSEMGPRLRDLARLLESVV